VNPDRVIIDEAALIPDDVIERQLRRIADEEREAQRLEAAGAVDLSEVKKQPRVKGPSGEEMTVEEAVALARAVQKTGRRRRRAGKVPHGRQMAIPKKRPALRTRRSK
jgi:hypothetical protein